MRSRLGNVLFTVVTIVVGMFTLVGLLVGPELKDFGIFWLVINDLAHLPLFASLFVQIAVLVVALMMILGIVNLLSVHATRLIGKEQRSMNRISSFVFLITFGGTLLLYLVERGFEVPSNQSASRMLLEQVQVAIESALAALLFFSLVYGASRILRTEVSLYRLLFLAMIVFVLVAALPFPQLDVVRPLYNWMLQVPVNAGARGLLMGIGLATALTGLRVLIGQDKTYH